MRRHTLLALVCLLLAAPLVAAQSASPASYTNALTNFDFPDPTVIRAADGLYYAYATQASRGGPVATASGQAARTVTNHLDRTRGGVRSARWVDSADPTGAVGSAPGGRAAPGRGHRHTAGPAHGNTRAR